MNPIPALKALAQAIPPTVRFWLYVLLVIWMVFEWFFDLVPTSIEDKIDAIAVALGLSVAAANVPRS